MKIEIEADEEQLGIVMSALEGLFPVTGPRTDATLDDAVEAAAERWTPGDDSFLYMTVKVAPVYRQLLQQWAGRSQEGGNCVAENLFEFVATLREARAGSSAVPAAIRSRTSFGQ
jgi:hypothetical protein